MGEGHVVHAGPGDDVRGPSSKTAPRVVSLPSGERLVRTFGTQDHKTILTPQKRITTAVTPMLAATNLANSNPKRVDPTTVLILKL